MNDYTQEGSDELWNVHEQQAWHGRAHRGPVRGRGFGPGRAWGRHGGHMGHGGPWGAPFGEGGEFWGGFFGPRGFGGGRERLERGALRYLILSVLKDGPQHGYEIIKQMEERTRGFYSPSPGTLYPTLQYLEDLELVHSDQEADKRVYNITDKGRAELEKQSEMVQGFWSRFQNRWGSAATQAELRFAGDAAKDLLRTLVDGFRSGTLRGDPETVRKVRAALERCENEIREIITQNVTGKPAQETPGSQGSQGNPDEPNTGAGTVRL